MSNPEIQDVSDTAFWVAHYRDAESERPDALFHDPYAKLLLDDRGARIADSMPESARYTRWSVIIRTCIIDRYLVEQIQGGVDTVLNLGAGLDTRPYRMSLPKDLRWIEVDYPHMIALKNQKLADEIPRCRLERVALDLADADKRRALFADIHAQSKRTLVLTEGVTIYLAEADVAALAQDLRVFSGWIVDYYAPSIYKRLQSSQRQMQMKNAPFRFFPPDWFAFFSVQGWKVEEMRYLAEESARLNRAFPGPWWMKLLFHLTPQKKRLELGRFAGYALMRPK